MMQDQARVLCVDDEPHILQTLRYALGNEFDVLSAQSPEEALDILEHDRDVEVVITDLRMPTAHEGKALIRSIEFLHDGPAVLILTAYAGDLGVSALHRQDVVMKPFDASLRGRVRAAVEARRAAAAPTNGKATPQAVYQHALAQHRRTTTLCSSLADELLEPEG
jgi:DNA-binding NtrC family response regulator